MQPRDTQLGTRLRTRLNTRHEPAGAQPEPTLRLRGLGKAAGRAWSRASGAVLWVPSQRGTFERGSAQHICRRYEVARVAGREEAGLHEELERVLVFTALVEPQTALVQLVDIDHRVLWQAVDAVHLRSVGKDLGAFLGFLSAQEREREIAAGWFTHALTLAHPPSRRQAAISFASEGCASGGCYRQVRILWRP